MKIKGLILALLSVGYCMADVNLWDQTVYYTFINKTNEPMEVSWQSGEDVQTGRSGSLNLPASQSRTIQASTSDCLDSVSVTGVATAQKATITTVCKREITIKYIGEVKSQKLVIEAQ
jgi:hypothetical protein